jgi:predicted SprT family Zn-dependent metalloprotease
MSLVESLAETLRIACAVWALETCPEVVYDRPAQVSPRSIAASVEYSSGRRALYLDEARVSKLPIWRQRAIVYHEIAHFATWERYGRDVEAHGQEFLSVCLKAGFTRKTHCERGN